MVSSGSPRAALYVRVSSEEQIEGYSLDAQERAGRLFCDAHAWELVAIYRDEGKSARSDDLAKRPEFHRLLADAEAARIDVIIVHRLDRFSRNLRVTLETLERLQRWSVGFVSINEQMDFTTPIGKVILATLAAFAQYYSDNLASEVRKGKAERKAQGLWNGVLPFGVKANSVGIPVPDPTAYPGLLLAFEAAAKGASDREVAVLLNERGFRTTGNRGRNLFTKDTVRPLLQNRFYLGELPDGRGGWVDGAHDPLLDDALFDAAQQARERRATNPVPVKRQATTYALSGLLRCQHCGGKLHLHRDKGRVRAYCYQARQGTKCPQRSTFLDIYEQQIVDYLATFTIPDDYRAELVAAQQRSQTAVADAEQQRTRLTNQLANIKTLFELGDLTKAEYLERRERLQRQLEGLKTEDQFGAALAQAAAFLTDLPSAWAAASPEQRNALARMLFQEIRIKDDWVAAVLPQPSFAPFFTWDCQARRLSGGSDGLRSRGCRMPDGAMAFAHFPERRRVGSSQRDVYQLPRAQLLTADDEAAIRIMAGERSLRDLAMEFGVSHETIRRVLRDQDRAVG